MMKLIGPVVTFVDRPWKMYPVGVLFGFGQSLPHPPPTTTAPNAPPPYAGFDTASSIALLAISAIAKRDPNGQPINPADIVVLPVRVLPRIRLQGPGEPWDVLGWDLILVFTRNLPSRSCFSQSA